jgi:integrase/recombinase XerD
MQEKDQSILTIIRCITAILQLRKQLQKSYYMVTKDDIKLLFKWMDNKQYKVETHEKYRAVLKKFYKMIYGNGESYPDCVSWFSVNVGKDKKSQERNIDINEYLVEEEVKKLIESAPTIQKKAFLSICYEAGARPEEHLRLSNLDCKLDTNGMVMVPRGKTGERRIRIVSFVPLLQQWLEIHPLKEQKQFPVWISTATNNKNKPLGLKAGERIIKEALYKAGLNNKKVDYIFSDIAEQVTYVNFSQKHKCVYSLDGSMAQKLLEDIFIFQGKIWIILYYLLVKKGNK